MPLTLERAPEGVEPSRWGVGSGGSPEVGDLWLLSWDGDALELAVVSAVAQSFVLVWPVTMSDDPAFRPAIVLAESPLGIPLHAWPTRETGVGLHLLHRRFGPALSARTMRVIEEALEEGETPPLPFAQANIAVSEIEGASDALVERWEAICLHQWPRGELGASPFDAEVLRVAGLEVGELADLLDVSIPEAVGFVRGETTPMPRQVELVAAALDVDPPAVLQNGLDADSRLLVSPIFKDDLLRIASLRQTDEGGARELVRSQFALAARSDGDPRSRLIAAIARLLDDGLV